MSKGSCLCGNVTYEFDGEPVMSALCHCLECRKVSGSAYTTNLLVPEDKFKISGALKTFVKKHESGMMLAIFFCENCGSVLYKTGTKIDFQGVVIVQAGTLDKPTISDVKLGGELYKKHRATWVPELSWATQFQEFP